MARLSFEEAQAKVAEIMGEPINRPVEVYQDWHFGTRVRIIEDDEDNGNYADDEGLLVFEEVGAPEYHNVRTAVGVVLDGYDSYNNIELDNVEPID